MELLKSEIPHSEVKSRVEGMLKKAGIGYLSEEESKRTPDAPVLKVRVVATKMESSSYPGGGLEGNDKYSMVLEAALLQKVIVESGSKLRISATTWLASSVSIGSGDDLRESILRDVDFLVFDFIKAYMIGNSKSAPRLSRFFTFVNAEEPTAAEARPKNLKWGAPHNGLQMAAWPSPTRPMVFCAIRSATYRTIHYCDYLLGYHETVRLFARQNGKSEWTPIPLRPSPHRAYIGVLLCGPKDSLGPGKEMAPKWNYMSDETPKIKRKYTFTEYLTSYDFPAQWTGTVECKITQTLFGGKHEDAWHGTVESHIFEINLPLKSS
jgi:hypothetical protein